MIYFFVFILAVLFFISEVLGKKNSTNTVGFFLLLLALFFISGFRFEVGTDWFSYVELYKYPQFATRELEPGYALVNELFSNNNFPFTVFTVFISAVSLAGVAYFIHKEVQYGCLALLIFYSDFFFYYNLSGIRQAMATSFLLVATIFLIKKKILPFVVFVILGTLFHKTAIIFLFSYGIHYVPNNKKAAFLLISAAFIAVYFTEPSAQRIVDLNYFSHAEYYFSSDYNNATTAAYILGLLKRSIPLFLCYYAIHQKKMKDPSHFSFIKLYFFGFIFYATFYIQYPDIVVRVSSYFIVFDMVLYSIYFSLRLSTNEKLFSILTVLCVTFYKIFGYSQIPSYLFNTSL